MQQEDLIVLLRYLANGNHKDVSIAHEAADEIQRLCDIVDRLHERLSAIANLAEENLNLYRRYRNIKRSLNVTFNEKILAEVAQAQVGFNDYKKTEFRE